MGLRDHRFLLAAFLAMSVLLAMCPPTSAQDLAPTDIIIIGHDAPGRGPNPEMIRANRDGEILWQKDMPFEKWGGNYDRYGSRNQREDALYLTTNAVEDKVDGKHRLLKFNLDLDTLDPLEPEWDIPLADTRIYVSANPVGGGVYALELEANADEVGPGKKLHKFSGDGTLLWSLPDFHAYLISTDTTTGGVYAATPDGVKKLDPDGELIWQRALPNGEISYGVDANPIDGGVYVGSESYRHNTRRLDADGNILWLKTSFPSPWTYGRAVSPLDGSIYIGSGWSHRLAHIAIDGTVLFNIGMPDYVPTLAHAIDEDAVYHGAYAEYGIRKYRADGTVVWSRLYGPAETPGDPGPWVGSYGQLGIYTGMPSAVADSDGDGIDDTDDNCPEVSNPEQTDTDLDGEGNACDLDDDNDGVPDAEDNCPFTVNVGQEDFDEDGFGDACDADPDGDFIGDDPGEIDNCPMTPNPFQDDTDGDGTGDACDEDDDNDGVCDTDQAGAECVAGPDNCPITPNPEQDDLEGDGIGDVCDADLENDGVPNEDDNCPLDANPSQDDTDDDGDGDACDADDDNDGIADEEDNCQYLPNFDQDDLDEDGQGDVCDGDLDGDGWDNETDNCPETPNSDQNDLDGDLVGDACDYDIDGDGVANGTDLCAATPLGEIVHPDNGCSIDQLAPCDGPRGTTQAWKNHGKYVSSVAHAANEFFELGLISEAMKDVIVSEAAGSTCGSKNK